MTNELDMGTVLLLKSDMFVCAWVVSACLWRPLSEKTDFPMFFEGLRRQGPLYIAEQNSSTRVPTADDLLTNQSAAACYFWVPLTDFARGVRAKQIVCIRPSRRKSDRMQSTCCTYVVLLASSARDS